ncbi:hypothetical protein [Pseudobacillus badius]|uniref:hypothetical protein n=1 Tax=Bacillus badius TaxID=1455 RepID=UPI0007B0840E|nr:hypothetical protein [Bacillus badius]KZN98594.1 hypothetical protein A4244_19580 [Bacillus badius]OCS83484.1 hypothetical protein A6M11_19595 [Bacillus badius]OVE46905.1 hypothetical protein B1A98_19035 [Bacillus badius]TDV98863.1 hypothetical protein B0G66_12516 [Bacillus badius]
MKKTPLIVLSGVLAITILGGFATDATAQPKEEVEKLVNSYLTALEEKDVSSLVKYADDLRFPDKKDQQQEYLAIITDETITGTNLLGIEKVSDTEFESTVEVINSGGSLDKLTLPIKQQKDGWKIIVGQDL